jgi:hypothetical protein
MFILNKIFTIITNKKKCLHFKSFRVMVVNLDMPTFYQTVNDQEKKKRKEGTSKG